MRLNEPAKFEAKDWLIVLEALAQWAGDPANYSSPRQERAWELIDMIAMEHGLPPNRLVEQIDDEGSV